MSDPFAAVCLVGEIRLHGSEATLHWARQLSFYKSLMLGESWAGLHLFLVSGSAGEHIV